MGLAASFQEVLDSLPDDWSDLDLDLRIFDESRYVEAATFLVVCNAQPYSHNSWHWKLLCAHRFGHAAAPQAVHRSLLFLDEAGIDGEFVVRSVRSGRAPVFDSWGRPESVREDFRRIHNQ